jgi:23S rRNA (cytosine1962-C5)-methyltransferase
MTTLTVFSKRVGPIRGRHPWVFSGALKHIPEGLVSGAPVELVDETGAFLAAGFFNSYSQIAVRLWSWMPGEEINQDFFTRRIRSALHIRETFVASKETDSYRLVYGENDLLPGLVVDKYSDYLSVQFHNPGIATWKKEIVAALVAVMKPKGIFERSDVRDRKRDVTSELSVETGKGVLYGEVPDIVGGVAPTVADLIVVQLILGADVDHLVAHGSAPWRNAG